MKYTTHIHQIRQSRPWIFWSATTVATLFILLLAARISAPYAIKWGAISWLETQQLEAAIIDIELQLYDGHARLSGLNVSSSNGSGASLGTLDIYWKWKPMFQRQLVVETVALDELQLDISLYDNGAINVGGILIPATTSPSTPTEPAKDDSQPWDIVLNNFLLSSINVCVNTVRHDMTVDEKSCVDLDTLAWAGDIAVRPSEHTDTSTSHPVYANGDLNITRPSSCIKQYDHNQTVMLDYCLSLDTLSWKGKIAVNQPGQAYTADALPLNVTGSFELEQLKVQNNVLNLALLKIESLNIDEIRIATLNDIFLSKLALNRLQALQRANPESVSDAQVLAFDSLNIHPVHLTNLDTLAIGDVTFDDLRAYFQINPDGKNAFHAWIPASKQKITADEQAEPRPFNYSLAHFRLNSIQHIIYKDTSTKLPFTLDIHDIDLELSGIDSQQPDQNSQLAVKFGIDKYGSFNLDAMLMPLAQKPSIKGKGQLTGFDLRLLAPMTKQYIGHNIKSGQLDAVLNIDVNKGIIDSNTSLTLNKFELKSLNKAEAERLNSEFGFPLNSTLSLLRDRDNTIRLDIPVTGDIEKPDFSPRDAVVKASSSAITTAVLHYYTPFGLVFAADALFDLATALSFEPLLFEPASAEITSAAHTEQIDNLATLMNERPGVHLTLCGTANAADYAVLFPKSKQAQDKSSGDSALSQEQLRQMHELAESRSSAIKNILVEKHSIASSRLIECSPEYVDQGISGVEISI